MKRTILIGDDDGGVRGTIREFLRAKKYEVLEAADLGNCRRIAASGLADAGLIDYFLPDGNALNFLEWQKASGNQFPVVVLTGHGTIDLAVRAVKNGAEQFLTKPPELQVLLTVLERALESDRFQRRARAHTAQRSRYERDPFLGTSAAIRRLAESVNKVLGTNSPILIEGETGTGKGVLASWLHQHGPRREEPFVDLNCAGLSRELFETELFGHERGAFTGAVAAKSGLLEVAHRGTVFLDEIGDMDLAIQPKLLKALEEKRFRRLGDVNDRRVDIHLLAASHRSLPELVAQGKFREDLFFRINTIPLRIPPLRERVEDLPMIAQHFVRQMAADMARPELEISADAVQKLQKHRWPGNLRELRNRLEKAALLCDANVIRPRDLEFEGLPSTLPRTADDTKNLTLHELQRRHIWLVLQEENGKVDRAASRLAIPRSTLYAKIKELKIGAAGGRPGAAISSG